MNRADRRAAARSARRQHLDCDCKVRRLEVIDPDPRCPKCSMLSPFLHGPLVMPTATPPGDLLTLTVGCTCGIEYDVVCLVHG